MIAGSALLDSWPSFIRAFYMGLTYHPQMGSFPSSCSLLLSAKADRCMFAMLSSYTKHKQQLLSSKLIKQGMATRMAQLPHPHPPKVPLGTHYSQANTKHFYCQKDRTHHWVHRQHRQLSRQVSPKVTGYILSEHPKYQGAIVDRVDSDSQLRSGPEPLFLTVPLNDGQPSRRMLNHRISKAVMAVPYKATDSER